MTVEVVVPNSLHGAATIPLGDSIMAASIQNNAANLGSWLPWASSGRLRVVRNAGVSGNRSDQMLARMQSDVTAYQPDVCVVMAGTNDAVQSVTLATYAANMEAIVSRLRAARITPVLCAVPPRTESKTLVASYNAWLAYWCAENGVAFVDTHTPLLDESTGGMNASYAAETSTPYTHPNQTGNRILSEAIWSAVGGLYPQGVPPLALHNTDAANLLVNGCFGTDSNADGTPDNWTVSFPNDITCSIETDTAIPGNWLKLVTTNTQVRTVWQSVATGGSTFAVGDTLLFCGLADIETPTGTAAWSVQMEFRNASNAVISTVYAVYQIGVKHPATDGVGFPFALETVVPANAASVRAYMLILNNAGTGRFARWALRNLTALGLV